MSYSYEVHGLDHLERKCRDKRVFDPLRDFFSRVTIAVQSKARIHAPVDTGHLRSSIQAEIDGHTPPLWGKVGFMHASAGSPLWLKARAMEYGTGRKGDKAVSHKASHFPPSESLDLWAKRHGLPSGYIVARAIARRGGLKPRKFLRTGLAESKQTIRSYLAQLGRDIRAAWDRK